MITAAILALGLMAPTHKPAALWHFNGRDAIPLAAHGSVVRNQAGPWPPEFPDFEKGNKAVRLNGNGAYLSLADPGPKSPFDFTNGNAITLEAWVKLSAGPEGQPMYVIGKGRTGSPRFARDNQNWALRVVVSKGIARLSFLFATAPGPGTSHWHRWTSKAGFSPKAEWHHIAVAYRFGQPKSIRGWIDGKPTAGVWDMGGETKKPPVVDDDAIWIGSSQGGNRSNSFRGWLDSVAIHRRILDEKEITSRFRRVGGARVLQPRPEVMPEIKEIPKGRVLVTFAEGLTAHHRWPNQGEAWPTSTTPWLTDAMLLPRLPLRYDSWGIRASWKAPLLVRIAADVDLSPGRHRILLRARALSRLWINGNIIARTKSISPSPNGEEPVTPLAKPPFPGLRPHGYHQQEVFGEVEIPSSSKGRQSRIVLELMVGGKGLRTETGEVCVAIQDNNGKTWSVLRPSGQPELPLTNSAIEPYLLKVQDILARHDDQARRQAAASQDPFWQKRHAIARDYVKEHPAPKVPTGTGMAHPIDAFVAAKIQKALAAASGEEGRRARKFHNEVLPILKKNCFRCHGEKQLGGLKLSSREDAIRGGESRLPALIPGKPEKSELIKRLHSHKEGIRMPPSKKRLTKDQIRKLEEWIRSGASWPARPVSKEEVAIAPVVGDEAFLRRVYLDTIGVPPTYKEAVDFLASTDPDKRARLIDKLLKDQSWADHQMSLWLDLLAENPTLLNASLNSTGPFRWFLYDAFRDHKPWDRMATELILMRGSPHAGGSAGFAQAAENDAPFAAKGHILASAFLGIELQCARCHDSPYHSTTQSDLYSIAAMLARKPITPPKTSRVPDAFFAKKERQSLIQVSLKPGQPIQPQWPFAVMTGVKDDDRIDRLMQNPKDSRERLAALITAPGNGRFAKVIVNRIWKRLMGAGLVEPVHDWEGRKASHTDLLQWLATELISHNYDARHIMRWILTSKTYQRQPLGHNQQAPPELRFFNAPDRRRLTAEQIVDSLFAVTGTKMDVEELTFVHDGRHSGSKRLTLGKPNRAWMFASLNNERDRPSLSLPRAQAVTDVLEAFGWTGSRQQPTNERESDPNVLQPGILANGTLSLTLTRAAYGSAMAQLAVEAKSPQALVSHIFLQVLNRRPKPEELAAFSEALVPGFAQRLIPADQVKRPMATKPLPLVTWSNHLRPEANRIQQEIERRARQGPPPDPRLRPEWRETFEDMIWSLINHHELVWMP